MYEQPSKPVQCHNCGTLFGYETARETLSIKHRDLYRTFTGGKVSGPCRRCGTVVEWPVVINIVIEKNR